MADTLTIPLTGPLSDKVRAAAKARGLSPEDYVRQQLEFDVEADAVGDDISWVKLVKLGTLTILNWEIGDTHILRCVLVWRAPATGCIWSDQSPVL